MKQYLLSVYPYEELAHMSEEDKDKAGRDVDAFNEELRASGAWVFAGGLHPADTASVVRAKNGDVVTTDGPFAEGKEQIGGFYVVNADDIEAALALAKKATVACAAPVEVRPFEQA
ncbi:MAG TPA: YciI family protein [Candidatus Solibacter sp.]|jgi:hypothetical protein|nr:YciI family protein [Candidatus Solibacter sp.]